jgi:hypothetical protein
LIESAAISLHLSRRESPAPTGRANARPMTGSAPGEGLGPLVWHKSPHPICTGRCFASPGVHRPLPAGRGEGKRGLKLSFDSGFVDNRPHLPNLLAPKFIKYILGKGNSLSPHIESKELSLWRTVELQPARYIRRIGNQQPNVEMKIRNFIKILFPASCDSLISRSAHRCAVTNDRGMPQRRLWLATRQMPSL